MYVYSYIVERKKTYRTLFAIPAGISNIVFFMTITATANAVTTSATNLHSLAVARDACAIRFSAIAHLATPSREAIASTTFTLASPAANLKRATTTSDGIIHVNTCNLSIASFERCRFP